jgi:hypothetical protein
MFTANEAMEAAKGDAAAAAAAGLRLPDLPHELERAGINSTHGLGRWLAAREGRGVSRAMVERTGVVWKVAVSRGDETADPIRGVPRAG